MEEHEVLSVVKELIQTFNQAGLTSLSLKNNGFELELEKKADSKKNSVETISRNSAVTDSIENNTDSVDKQIKSSEENTTQHIQEGNKTTEDMNKKMILSPMVGTFYGASSPKAEPFVKVGTIVKKGDIVCVIEAMKLMNEVESEVDGEVVEILINNEEMVEYGQPMFVLR